MTARINRGGRPAREGSVRMIGVEYPEDIAKKILGPVDDGQVKTITDRMIALVKIGLEHEPPLPQIARQVELPMTGT